MEGLSGNSGVGGERGRAGGRWLLLFVLLSPFLFEMGYNTLFTHV